MKHLYFISIFLHLINNHVSCTTIKSRLKCDSGEITGFRIKGCDAEPCNIRKGERLPVEIDFHFDAPEPQDRLRFEVWAIRWSIGGKQFLGKLAQEEISTCKDKAPEDCPLQPGQSYTITSSLYADPNFQSRNGDRTGQAVTTWDLRLYSKKGENAYYPVYFACEFNMVLNIVE